MTATALIAPPASDDPPDTAPIASHLLASGGLLAGLPPLLSVVPVAVPAVFVDMGFGVVLLLLLVPPLALLAIVVGVPLVVLAGAILEASFRLVCLLRGHPLGHFSLSVPHIRKVKVRRA